MSHISEINGSPSAADGRVGRGGIAAFGGLLAALAASSCCVLPLALFGLGVSGAWIGQLTALAVYQPIFMVLAFGFLGYGYWRVFGRKTACETGKPCARPLPSMLVRVSLFAATALVLIALAWPVIVPLILS